MARNFAFLLLFCLFSVIEATLLDATWNNSVYAGRDTLDSLRPFPVFYEDISFDGRNLGGSNFSLSSHLNYTNRFAQTPKKSAEVTHLYLDWKSESDKLSFRAGRQGYFEGVQPVFLDGLRCETRIFRNFSLTGVAGLKIPSTFSSKLFDARPDSSTAHVFVSANTRFGERTLVDILYHQTIKNKLPPDHSIGFDISEHFTDHFRAATGLHYNIIDRKPVDFLFSLNWIISQSAAIATSLTRIVEHIDTVSFGDTLQWETHSAATISGNLLLFRQLAIGVSATNRFFSGSTMQTQLSGHTSWKILSLTYREDFGDLGKGNRANAIIHVPYQAGTVSGELGASAGYMTYRFPILDTTLRKALSGRAFGEISPWKDLSIRIEYQVLQNRFYKIDNRVYLNTCLHFNAFGK